MKTIPIHFTHEYLLNPTNSITVNVIGAGGTGSQVLHGLARMNATLQALDHPGLYVRAFDHKTVNAISVIRQRFSQAEIGVNKSVTMINKLNCGFGTNWKAIPDAFGEAGAGSPAANITITCTDTIESRYQVADLLTRASQNGYQFRDNPIYWIDCGNADHTGQVILSTVREVAQPKSKKYAPIGKLPMITEEFQELLQQQQATEKDQASCSVVAALQAQDLFINIKIATEALQLLWVLFRNGKTRFRGAFVNMQEFNTQPLPVKP